MCPSEEVECVKPDTTLLGRGSWGERSMSSDAGRLAAKFVWPLVSRMTARERLERIVVQLVGIADRPAIDPAVRGGLMRLAAQISASIEDDSEFSADRA